MTVPSPQRTLFRSVSFVGILSRGTARQRPVSNEWMHCDSVVYFLDDHKPGSAHVVRKHAIVGNEITNEALEDAQNYLRGEYGDIKRGSYLANMMQLIGRGQV